MTLLVLSSLLIAQTTNEKEPLKSTNTTNMTTNTALGFFKLIVKNQDLVENFYKEVFGFERVDHIDYLTFEERVLRLPDGSVSLVLYSHKDGRAIKVGNGHGPVGLVTKEVDELHAKALSNGAKEKMGPMQFGPARVSFLFDPEGHEVELINLNNSNNSEKDMTALKSKWDNRIESGKAYTTEEMMPDYLALAPISIEEIIGKWHGGKFDGGTTPDPINWYGKYFHGPEHVEPLMIKTPEGIVPFTKLGSARLREVFFKNQVSATIIYNNQPIMDYFRKVDDNTIIGWGEVKGETPDFFFWLKREEAKK